MCPQSEEESHRANHSWKQALCPSLAEDRCLPRGPQAPCLSRDNSEGHLSLSAPSGLLCCSCVSGQLLPLPSPTLRALQVLSESPTAHTLQAPESASLNPGPHNCPCPG